jgi:hypothetical protein
MWAHRGRTARGLSINFRGVEGLVKSGPILEGCERFHIWFGISLTKEIIVPVWGMHHTSTALYFYGASKKTLHKPRVTFGNMLFQISYSFHYYLQLLVSI